MGTSQSLEDSSLVNPDHASLSDLLGAEPVLWPFVAQILRNEPEQACLYAHFVEPSQLYVSVQKGAPVDVIHLFLDAYEDALDHSFHGETVLHAAMEHSDEESLQRLALLLHRRPCLAWTKDMDGLLPLQRNLQSPSIAEILVKAYPEGLKQRSRHGRLALHHALLQEELAVPVVQKLVSAAVGVLPDSGILSRDKSGDTPLHLLCRRLENLFISDDDTIKLDENEVDVWNLLINWILRLAGPLPRITESPLLELHLLIDYGCCSSRSMIRYALQQFPNQAFQRDGMGRTPLHVAAGNRYPHDETLIEYLIAVNPKAPRMIDNEGRLPIDVAAATGKTEVQGLTLLVQGEPRAIDTRDLRDGYYPFLSAALGEHDGVSTTYSLLRAKPHVLSYFHPS